ncbi:hypothetical protein [Opitutus sp. ER46]|uniref:hypothetical protein n=1 Tax=Opitutus sp. ER46 TaxID=2161864 RepID=UPI000D31DDA9|nr:hypothetical protein [Opitutus sp. ER46]PTX95715.1 hypothetical protein DB354_09900 [Opitutus sp. ER46]
MRLFCPKCASEIPATNANLAEGVCSCPRCAEFFQIAALLGGEPDVASVPKPAGSPVELVRTTDGLGLVIPRGRRWALAVGLGLFAVFWGMIVGTIFKDVWTARMIDVTTVAVAGVFLVAGVGIVCFAVFIGLAEFTLLVGRDECLATWTILTWKYTRRIPRAAISGVVETVRHTQNGLPWYSIGIMHGTRILRFGSSLTHAERAWLISELRMYLGKKPVASVAE